MPSTYVRKYVCMCITHIVLKVVTLLHQDVFSLKRGCMQINLDTYPTQGKYKITTQSHAFARRRIF